MGELQIPDVWDAEESRFPGIWETGESGIVRVAETGELLCNLPSSGIPGSQDSPVLATPGSRFWTVHFCSNLKPLLQPLKQQSIQKQCASIIYYANTLGSGFKGFLNFIISDRLPGVLDAEELLKTVNNSQKNPKTINGSR